MRFLSYDECAEWCRRHGYPLRRDHSGRPAPDLTGHRGLELEYPADSGRKVALARQVMNWGAEPTERLLWVGEWGVWPSSEHMPLFLRFRQALGEGRGLIDAPGHVVSPEEVDDGISVLACALLFIWDCRVFSATGGQAYETSHDEWNGLYLPVGADLEATRAHFDSWLA